MCVSDSGALFSSKHDMIMLLKYTDAKASTYGLLRLYQLELVELKYMSRQVELIHQDNPCT